MDLADLAGPWSWSGQMHRWVAGRSWFEPYAHAVLEHSFLTDGTTSLVVVRERRRGSPGLPRSASPVQRVEGRVLDAVREETLRWPLEFRLAQFGSGAVEIATGFWGIAPMQLVASRGVLHGSWDLADLRPQLSVDFLVDHEVGRLLAGRRSYAHTTIWNGVVKLTERSRVRFTADGLAPAYPEPAGPATLDPPDSGVVTAYEARLAEAVSCREFDPGRAAVELTGGMDSANVAMTLAALYPGRIRTCTVLVEGEAGAQQRRRRQEMIEFAGFRDDAPVPGPQWAPLHPHGARGRGLFADPSEEPFAEAVDAMLEAVRRHDVRVAFTGMGGDEMLACRKTLGDQSPVPDWITPHIAEHRTADELVPASVIRELTLTGFAARWPMYLRAGCWPISPLAAPEMIGFGQSLSADWRDNKRICRERLARLGLSDLVVNPPLPERFGTLMDHGLRRYGIPQLRSWLANSMVLVELGYVDGRRLQAACERATLDRRLFPVVALEAALRALAV